MTILHNNLDTSVFSIHQIAGNNPGAGNNFATTIEDDARWQIIACQFNFNTEATVGNRVIRVAVNGATANSESRFPEDIPESRSMIINAAVGLNATLMASVTSRIQWALPDYMFVIPGETIEILIGNIQPLDTLTSIAFRLKRWIT